MVKLFFIIVFLIPTSVYSGGSEKHIVFPNENEEIVTRLQNCSSNQFTKDIFLQYENSDGTLKEPDGYVYYFENIDNYLRNNPIFTEEYERCKELSLQSDDSDDSNDSYDSDDLLKLLSL